MRQVFYNLASNAFKAMPDGGTLTIRLEARRELRRIRFEDTGRGIEEDEMKKLFVPFNSPFRERHRPWTADRLSDRERAQRDDFRKSRSGAGTIFTWISDMSKRARILIVDDERSIRELLEIFPEEGRLRGPEQLKALTEGLGDQDHRIRPDRLRYQDAGHDRNRSSARGSPNSFDGQFILLTAFATAETAIQALKMGAFDYIIKTENFIEELKLVVLTLSKTADCAKRTPIFGANSRKFTGWAT